MPRSFESDTNAQGLRFAIVASRFNDEYVDGLLQGALSCLERHGADDEEIDVFRVPGAFEIPAVVDRLAAACHYDAIIALGALVRGETPHFEYISSTVTSDLSRIALLQSVPVAYGVITCNTAEQAAARSGSGSGNKGWEAALAAIEMANLFQVIEENTTR